MKLFTRQALTFLLTLSVCLQASSQPLLCAQIFSENPLLPPTNLFQKIILPRALLRFDLDLYWKARLTDVQKLNLSEKDLDRVEVKLGLIDSLRPGISPLWIDQIPHMNSLRQRELNSLIAKYSLPQLQDAQLRRIFITQLSLLKDTPWMGLKKAFEQARNEDIQAWAERNLEDQLLNFGLEGTLQKFHFANPSVLAKGKLYLKKALANKWIYPPRSLPLLGKQMNEDTLIDLLWAGAGNKNSALAETMLKDHVIENYNEFTRNYNIVSKIAFAILALYLLPQLSDELEGKIKKDLDEKQNSPEAIKKRDEEFQKTLRKIEEMNKAMEEMAQKDPLTLQYEMILSVFEKANQRPASEAEKQELRKKLGMK